MTQVSAIDVRAHIIELLSDNFRESGLDPDSVCDDIDLLDEGVIDSIGLLQVLTNVEDFVGQELDFEGLDADNLGVLGALCSFVSNQLSQP